MTLNVIFTIFTLPFLQRALLAGLCLGIAAAFLGVFITLRNLSFYSDTIAHSALAGIALGLLLHVHPVVAAMVFCVLIGLLTVWVKNNSTISLDTVVGVIFSAGLSLGVVLMSFLPGFRSELYSILFGDILTLNWFDVLLAAVMSVVVIAFLKTTSRRLLLNTFAPEFSTIRGLHSTTLDYAFFVITAITVALSIKIVGIILVTGLLILPAAVAKNLAHSFKQMVWLAMFISACSTVLGLFISYVFDLPAGPSIILVSTVGFGLSLIDRVK